MRSAPSLLAAAKRTDPNSWALLADTHLAADRALVARDINMTDHFTKVSGELLALPKRPAGVFITGDCAYNSGQTGDYRHVADLLEPIRQGQMPVHLALGNHDHRERFWEAIAGGKGHPTTAGGPAGRAVARPAGELVRARLARRDPRHARFAGSGAVGLAGGCARRQPQQACAGAASSQSGPHWNMGLEGHCCSLRRSSGPANRSKPISSGTPMSGMSGRTRAAFT